MDSAPTFGVHANEGGITLTPPEVQAALRQSAGKRARVTFDDGMTQSADIASVDDEAFLHSGPDGAAPACYWTRFESVRRVERPAEP
jgi:hypothetical protein